jgi:hypothetical protein
MVEKLRSIIIDMEMRILTHMVAMVKASKYGLSRRAARVIIVHIIVVAMDM